MPTKAVTADQMKALEYWLTWNPDKRQPVVCQTLLWLLRQTECLSQEVAVELPMTGCEVSNYATQVSGAIHDFNGCHGKARLQVFMKAMGTTFGFDFRSFDRRKEGTAIFIGAGEDRYNYKDVDFDEAAIKALELPRFDTM